MVIRRSTYIVVTMNICEEGGEHMTKKSILAFAALALSFLFTVGVVSAQTVTPTPTGNTGVDMSGNTGIGTTGPASGVGGSGVSNPDNAPSTGFGGTAQ